LDRAGRVPGGEIWLTDGLTYKFSLETSTSVVLGTYDNISGINDIPDVVLTADNVFYDPPFAGAVTTGYTVQDKLAQYVSAKDFGAEGDGVTNDTAAIQTAIDTVSAAGGGTVHISAGTYMINMVSGGIFLKSNVQVVGEGPGTILKGIPISGTSNFVYVVSIASCTNAGISNCVIDASRPSGETDQKQWHGIRLEGDTSDILIENNTIKECKGDGIWIVLNPGFAVPPTKALIRGNKISNVNRQDIALVEGTKITITENFGTGTLDVEANSSANTNDGHIISANQFPLIYISPLSGLAGAISNITVTGNRCDEMFLWGVNFVSVVGNVVNGRIFIAQSGSVSVVGNTCQAIRQAVANGTNVQNLILKSNTIISSTEAYGIWIKDAVAADISDNKIIMTAVGSYGIYHTNASSPAAGTISIFNNDILSDSHAIYINSLSSANTLHSVKSNTLKSTSGNSIFKDGSTTTGTIEFIDNQVYDTVLLRKSTSVKIMGNNYYNVASVEVNFNTADNILVKNETYFTQVPTYLISSQTVSGSVVVQNCAGADVTIGASKFNFFSLTATDVFLDNIVSSSATPFTALTATIRSGSVIRITGSATRFGIWYNGTAWVDLA